MSTPSKGRIVSPRPNAPPEENPDLFYSPQPARAGDDLDEDEEGFATMSQLAYQKPTFPVEEEALTFGRSRPGKIVIDERVEPFEVGDFATTYLRPDRQSVSVGNEVDLVVKPPF